MNNLPRPVTILLSFLFYWTVQVLLFPNFVLFENGFAFPYIAFVLSLPFEVGTLTVIFLSFAAGISVDVFYNSLGIHAAASTFLGFLRGHSLRLLANNDNIKDESPNFRTMGFSWMTTYALPLIFAHHLLLFYLEGGFDHFFFTLWKVLFTSAISFVVILLLQYVIHRGKRSYF